MSTVDISRFAHGLSKLLAPAVQEGQVLYAFLEKQNSLTVRADNVLKTPVMDLPIDESPDACAQNACAQNAYAYILLENGTDDNGDVRIAPMTLGPLNPNAYDEDKIMAVCRAIDYVVTMVCYSIEYVDPEGKKRVLA